MEFYGGGGESLGNLRTSLQTGSAAPAEGFVSDDHAAGIGLIPLPHAVHAGIDAGPAMEAVFFVDRDMVSWESLALFPDLLVKARPDHVEEPVKLRAAFHLLDKLGYLLNREIDGTGQIFLQVIEKLTML